jgi:hypothetical protein
MRIYIIGNDGITLCREPPAAVNEGEIARSLRTRNCAQPGSVASGCWRCGMLFRMSRGGERSATATR